MRATKSRDWSALRSAEDTIIELAKLNQLGLRAGELEAMRLAGLSDAILLEVARHRAAGKPVLAGASLANLKNAGVRELTLLELARRGVPDSQAAAIIDVSPPRSERRANYQPLRSALARRFSAFPRPSCPGRIFLP